MVASISSRFQRRIPWEEMKRVPKPWPVPKYDLVKGMQDFFKSPHVSRYPGLYAAKSRSERTLFGALWGLLEQFTEAGVPVENCRTYLQQHAEGRISARDCGQYLQHESRGQVTTAHVQKKLENISHLRKDWHRAKAELARAQFTFSDRNPHSLY